MKAAVSGSSGFVASGSASDSVTASNSQSAKGRGRGFGKPFKKNDPRINRYGKPKGYDMARKATVDMFAETIVSAPDRNGVKHAVTRFQLLMMDWVNSKNFQKQKAALEMAGLWNKNADSLVIDGDMLRSMTNSQLERLSKGESVFEILLHPN